MPYNPLEKIKGLIDRVHNPEQLVELYESIKDYIIAKIEIKASEQLEKSNQIQELTKKIKG